MPSKPGPCAVRRFGRLCVLGTVVGLASLQVRAQTPPPNVLLITIDTVRADHIGAYGDIHAATPTIDRLAKEGVRFSDATTQAPLTGPAHAALLTGLYPARLGVRDNATTPLPADTATIASLFKSHGYRTGGFVGAFILGPEYGFAQGFDTFDAAFQQFNAGMKLQAQRRGGEVATAAIQWLKQGPQPFFAWVHLYDAHTPYDAPAPFGARFKAAPYDGEIAYVDACIGRLVAALEQRLQLDRTLVVVVADHGEGLGDHGESEHGMFLYESVLRIPWIMRLPARAAAGSVVTTQVRAVDVMPTIAAIAGLTPPANIDGQNVVPMIGAKLPRDPVPSFAETYYPRWHYGWSELTSIRVGDWKYIDAPRPELYEVRADPGERNNVVTARSPLAGGLSAELAKVVAGLGRAASADAPRPDSETLARLRSLGYLGMAAPGGGRRGADPKDLLPQAELLRTGISRAVDALDHGQPDAAIEGLKRLLAVNDRSYELHLFLGDAYSAKKQFENALGEYSAAKLLYPGSAAPLVSAARVYLALGNALRALDQVNAAGQLEPGNGEVSLVRGMALEQLQQFQAAIAAYQAAVKANGFDIKARASLAGLALQMNLPDEARRQFETLLKMGYRPSRMHLGLGHVARINGDRSRAEAEFRLALKLEPGLDEARIALAQIGAIKK